jgi:hypothetical protein
MALTDDQLAEVAAGKAFLRLKENPDFQVFVRSIEQEIIDRSLSLMNPIANVEEGLNQNFRKGTVVGLRFALDRIDATVARLTEIQAEAAETKDDDEIGEESSGKPI